MTTKQVSSEGLSSISKDLYHRDTVKPSKRLSRRGFIESALLGCAVSMAGCSKKPLSESPASRHHLIDFAVTGDEGIEAARRAGANGIITPLDTQTERSYIEAFKSSARLQGLEPGFWIEIGRDQEAAITHTEWLHVPQHTDWLAQFPDWSGGRAAVFPWLPLNNRAVFDYQVAKVVSIASKLDSGDSIYLSNVQNPPAGCGCGNLQCRSWDNSQGEKIAPSPYEHKEIFFTSQFMETLKAKIPAMRITPIICPECEQSVLMGTVENPDAKTGYCNSINCSDPCGGFYYPGLVRALNGIERVGLLCTYKAMRRDLPIYGEPAAWVSANIGRYSEHGAVTKLLPVLQGWDVSEDEIKAQLSFVEKAKVRGYIISLMPLENSFWPVTVS